MIMLAQNLCGTLLGTRRWQVVGQAATGPVPMASDSRVGHPTDSTPPDPGLQDPDWVLDYPTYGHWPTCIGYLANDQARQVATGTAVSSIVGYVGVMFRVPLVLEQKARK